MTSLHSRNPVRFVKAALRLVQRKPWVRVAVAGGLLVVIAVRARPAGETIVVAPEIVEALVREREDLLGRSVSPQERPALIARYVNDEILLREAYARELHRRDGSVRKRLLEIMRSVLLEEPSEPTEGDLRAYLRDNADVYRTPPAVTFSHVFYSAGEGTPAVNPARVLSRLGAGADFRQLGEPFWLGKTLEGYSEPQLAQGLGREFAQKVMSLPLNEWSGPLVSNRGTHFVRVDERRPPEMPAFSDLVPTLRSDWLASKRDELLLSRVNELRGRYRVKIDSGTVGRR